MKITAVDEVEGIKAFDVYDKEHGHERFYLKGSGSLDYHIHYRRQIIEKQYKEIEQIKRDIKDSKRRLKYLTNVKGKVTFTAAVERLIDATDNMQLDLDQVKKVESPV